MIKLTQKERDRRTVARHRLEDLSERAERLSNGLRGKGDKVLSPALLEFQLQQLESDIKNVRAVLGYGDEPPLDLPEPSHVWRDA